MSIILEKEAIEFFNKTFYFVYTGVEQDWDLEMAAPNRIDEFISYYFKTTLSENQKIALVALILASYEDLLNDLRSEIDTSKVWNSIRLILTSENGIFDDLVHYWSCERETDTNNWFSVTPFIRELGIYSR